MSVLYSQRPSGKERADSEREQAGKEISVQDCLNDPSF
jgi:hypothetical protein